MNWLTFRIVFIFSVVIHLLFLCAAAVLFRYNAVSLTYLLFLLASFLLPSTRNSTHSGKYSVLASMERVDLVDG